MFFNYLNASLRNFLKHKSYTLINILGLTIGFAACMLIILFVKHETNYDRFLPNTDRIHRIAGTYHFPGREAVPVATFFGGAREMLIKDYEEIEDVTSLRDQAGSVIRGDDIFIEQLFYATPNFLEIIELPFIEGNPETALQEKLSIILSRDMAQKHLGNGPWVGKTMTIRHGYERDVQVTGVFDIPDNSHFKMDLLLPHDEQVWGVGNRSRFNNWGFLGVYQYAKLKEGYSIDHINDSLNDFLDRYVPEGTQKSLGMKGHEIYAPRTYNILDIHLEDYGQYQMKPPTSWGVIYGFVAIAGIILSVAAINFMNLATASATLREKEVAMRKVSGADRSQLFAQFQGEALFLAVLSLGLGYFVAYLALPYFNSYGEVDIAYSGLVNTSTILGLLGLTIFTGFLAGLYPSLLLSNTRPSKILMSGRSASPSVSKFRTTLVVLQFTASTALILSTLIVYFQTDHARTVDLGYERDHAFAINGIANRDVKPSSETLKERIQNLPNVNMTSLSSFAPGDRDVSALRIKVADNPQPLMIFYRSVDYDFFGLYKVKALAGRLFDRDHSTDELAPDANATTENPLTINLVINMSMVKMLGLSQPQEALNQVYTSSTNGNQFYKIIGVIPDTHFKTPKRPMIAEAYYFDPNQMTTLNISFKPGQAQSVGQEISIIWKEMFPRIPLNSVYVEDYVSEQFHGEVVFGNIMTAFSGLAILVACMGLFGLASFSAERRTKEIGVRKVMGASGMNIVTLMLSQFSKPVLISNIIAWPFSWYFLTDWINSFHYRIDLVSYFTLVGILGLFLTLIIAWMTVSFHAAKVARTSPIVALHHD